MAKLKCTGINWGSINKKVLSAADEVKDEVMGKILLSGSSGGGGTGHMSISEGAQAFANILADEIGASAMTDGAAQAIGQPTIGAVEKLSETSARVTIHLGNGNVSRTSLVKPSGGYTGGGIDDIVILLNNGYTASHSVYGAWPGHTAPGEYIHSLATRPGYEFINRAISAFDSIKDQYNITSVTCEGVNA